MLRSIFLDIFDVLLIDIGMHKRDLRNYAFFNFVDLLFELVQETEPVLVLAT